MTTKRTHGPCTCTEAAVASGYTTSHLPDCPSLYPAQQEPDALTRLVRLMRTAWMLTPNATNRVSSDDFEAQALALISEARAEMGALRNRAEKADRARSEEARLLEENKRQAELLADAYRSPSLLAWRAASPHGFSRVYADDEAHARVRGAFAQRCDEASITVARWPEEDLCKARQAEDKDAQIKALADALARTRRETVPHPCRLHWNAPPEHQCWDCAGQSALRLVGRLK